VDRVPLSLLTSQSQPMLHSLPPPQGGLVNTADCKSASSLLKTKKEQTFS